MSANKKVSKKKSKRLYCYRVETWRYENYVEAANEEQAVMKAFTEMPPEWCAVLTRVKRIGPMKGTDKMVLEGRWQYLSTESILIKLGILVP